MAGLDLQALLATEPLAFARQILQSLGLAFFPLEPAHGRSNRVWLTSSHVIRISSDRFHDAYAHESSVLQLLPAAIPHARLLACGRVGSQEWMVQERVPGMPLMYAWRRLSHTQRQSAVTQLGHALRALHAVQVPDGLRNPWLDDALAPGGHPENAYHAPPQHFHLLLAAAQQIPDADHQLLDEVGAFVEERLDAFTGDRAVLAHVDIHFANVMWHEQTLTAVLDFEGSRLAAPDQELDTLLRFVREPAVYGGSDSDAQITPDELCELPGWLAESYPKLFAHPRLIERLEVYEALWHLVQVFHFPPGSGALDPWAHLKALLSEPVFNHLMPTK